MLTILAIGTILTYVAAVPNIETTTACDELYARYPQHLAYDPVGPSAIKTALNAMSYASTNMEYWHKENSDHRSACTFMPASAEHVADAVRILNRYSNVPFALKGGGHNPAPGFNAVHEGVLIAFEVNLGSSITTRTPDGNHFIVGPGARWGEVYKYTGQTQQVVVGGRLAHVGVGGFLLGGGLSYLSAQYGFGCDNVDMFEAVLANGTIVQASREQHPELWWALRGGGNQFAIVTRFWLRAHPEGSGYGQVW
ncbi:FAD-dependent monooxygenase CTB5 [Pseudocercospora fuligena]|uniref:FAD-dependent monooxygenase CTB5 n=1 Tax=Pseudocercospora fuligena TaxID=685502 RepID=A0A8H6VJ69_9PEZI|nr:FAD-dependent monooxygenase CTB5 [Pseudocercospora fuligena]